MPENEAKPSSAGPLPDDTLRRAAPAPAVTPTLPAAWAALRQFTHARIALGRTGDSLPTRALLAFNLSHAQARDAVHQPMDIPALAAQLQTAGWQTLDAASAAPDRDRYLRRPDLGRRLNSDSVQRLERYAASAKAAGEPPPDVVFVVADGLSAHAAMRHAVPLLAHMQPALHDWRVGPVILAAQSRVALGDGIGSLLGARIVVMLIGERPGLSSPDSLGIYLTYAPQVGMHDAQRNCISNVRPEGLDYAKAAFKLHYLLNEARRLSLTGVALKDDSDAMLPGAPARPVLE